VEKEIEVACVDRDGLVVDCNYGVVFPQNTHEKLVEVTLSKSFFNQDTKSAVLYWVLWECKQDEADYDLDGDTTECRYDLPDDIVIGPHDKWTHPGFPESGPLDGNLRDYVDIDAPERCLLGYTGPASFDKDIEGVGNGRVSIANPKCFYDLILSPPACEGSFNPFTDPAPAPATVKCHEITDSTDPQDWERFVELGDNFKIQVYDFAKD